MGKTFLCLLMLLVLSGSAWGADTWYVSTTGTDDGGHGAATGADAWATLDYALTGDRVAGGDTVYLETGTHNTFNGANTQIASDVGAGDSSAVIVQGTGSPVIDVPAGCTDFYVRPPDGTPLEFHDISITNTNTVAVELARFNAGMILTFDTCVIDWNLAADRLFHFQDVGDDPELYLTSCTIRDTNASTSYPIINSDRASSPKVQVFGTAFNTVGTFCVEASPMDIQIRNSAVVGGTLQYFLYLSNTSNLLDLKYNKFTMNSTNTNPFAMAGDALADVLANPGNYDIVWNVVWRSDGVTTHLDVEELVQFGVDYRNYYLDPSSDNATTVVGGAIPSVALGGTLAAVGDSILNGSSATAGNYWDQKFQTLTGLAVTSGVSEATIAGLNIEGGLIQVDRLMTTYAPSTVFVLLGANNFGDPAAKYPSAGTAQQWADEIEKVLQKIEDYGATPICLGPTSTTSDPVDNTDPEAVDDILVVTCSSNGWQYDSVLDNMNLRSDGLDDGVYYADLATNIHPNNAGHSLIASIAGYLYFGKTPFSWGGYSHPWNPPSDRMPSLGSIEFAFIRTPTGYDD